MRSRRRWRAPLPRFTTEPKDTRVERPLRVEHGFYPFKQRIRRTECASDVSSAVASDAVVVADRRPEGDDLIHRRVPGPAVERVDIAVGLASEGEVEARAVDVRVRLMHGDYE